jgi:D-alanyl-D-alanine carboxypeptidase (penicillin-binding protein 5/6)
MAICARAAVKNPTIRSIIKTKGYNFRFSNGRTKYLKNTNRLLRSVSYCNGMKTGTTNASGRCLIASGTLNGRTAIVCVFGATSSTIWRDSERLLRWALERPASR